MFKLDKILAGYITLFSVLVMGAWIFRAFPDFVSVETIKTLSFNAPFIFTFMGLALLIPVSKPVLRYRAHIAVAIGVFCIATLTLLQDILNVDFKIDQLLMDQSWVHTEQSPYAIGRMSPQASFCAIVASLIFFLTTFPQNKRLSTTIQFLCFVIFAIGGIGLCGNFIRLEWLYSWYKYPQMTIFASGGYMFLAIALWSSWYHKAESQGLFDKTNADEKRISAVATAIITFIATSAGVFVFSLSLKEVQSAAERSFQVILDSNISLVQDAIQDGLRTSHQISDTYILLQKSQGFATNENRLQLIRENLNFFLGNDVITIIIYDEKEKIIAQVGDDIGSPELEFEILKDVKLRYLDGHTYFLTRQPIKLSDNSTGAIVVYQKLFDIDKVISFAPEIGETADIGICSGLDSNRVICLPSFLNRNVVPFYPRVRDGRNLIITHALDGKTGKIITRDYFGNQVIAAFAPIKPYNLAIVIKKTTAELYEPIKGKLYIVMAIIGALIIIGVLALRYQWLPLIQKVLASERQIRESNERFQSLFEASTDAHLLFDETGIIDCNLATLQILKCNNKEDIIGVHPALLSPTFQPGGVRSVDRSSEILKKLKETGYQTFEWVHRNFEGQEFSVEVILKTVLINEKQVTLSVWHDLTERKKYEEQILASEQRLKLLIKHTPAAVAMFDQDMRYIMTSDRWLSDYKLKGKDVIGRSHFELFPKVQDTPEWKGIFKMALNGHVQSCEEERWIDRDGKVEWLKWAIHPWHYADRQIAGIIMFTEFITERKKAQEALQLSEQRLRLIMDSSYHSIIATDVAGKITIFNKASERMLGYTAEEMIGKATPAKIYDKREVVEKTKRYSAKFGKRIKPDFQVFISQLQNQDVDQQEWTYVRKDGSKFPVMLSVTPLRGTDNNIVGYVGLGVDISERKALERMKNEFVSTVSHELRTPLTSIRGSIGLILSGISGPLSDKMKNLLSIAQKNCERLILLINDILDIEKIESGSMRFDFKNINLKEFVEQAVILNQSYAEKYNVEYLIEGEIPDIQVHVDEDRLMQVIANLLSNAAKFSPPGSKIKITSSLVDGMVRVAVKDQGIGIPDEFRPRIFGRFAQADASNTKKQGGTGLGLSISKAIIEHMEGRIGFDSEMGKGSTFYFDLKLEDSADSIQPLVISEQNSKILVFVGRGDIDQALKTGLEENGFTAEIVSNFESIKDNLGQFGYSSIVLDVKEAKVDVMQLISEIRSQQLAKKIPILVISNAGLQQKTNQIEQPLEMVEWLNSSTSHDKIVEKLKELISLIKYPTILHVEDDEDVARVIAYSLAPIANYIHASSLQEAQLNIERNKVDLVLLDLFLPDGNGIELLDRNPELLDKPVIVLSAGQVPQRIKDKVTAALVKSKTSEAVIIETVKKLIVK